MLKGSRVREYLQQNQRLLAALPGQSARTRYNQTWIGRGVDLNVLEPGLPALILFSDRPHETIAPVRHARLEAAHREGDYLELDLRLEEFVAPDVAGADLRAHTAGFPQEPFDDDGRKCYVDISPHGWSLPRAADEAATETAWRRTVDFLVSSPEEAEFYRQAVFFRPVGLYAWEQKGLFSPGATDTGSAEAAFIDEDTVDFPPVEFGESAAAEDAVAGDDLLGQFVAAGIFAGFPLHEHPNLLVPRTELTIGTRYSLEFSAHNPHLSEEELRYLRLSPDGRGAFVFLRERGAFPHLVRDGWVQLEFVTKGRGELILEVSVTGRPETSSFFSLAAIVEAGAAGAWSGPGAEAPAPDESTPAFAPESAEGVAEEGRHLHLVGEESPWSVEAGPHVGEAGPDVAAGTGEPTLLHPDTMALDPTELLRLEEWLGERMGLEDRPEEHLDLFREFFGSWAPHSTAVAERQAGLAFAQGSWEEVRRLLAGREGLSEEGKHRRFLAGLEQRRVGRVGEEAMQLSWTGEYDGYFEHFLRLVPELPAEARRELADRLPFAIWGDEKSCRFLKALMDLEPDQDLAEIIAGALEAHAELFGLSADDVLAWLIERLQTFDRPSAYLIGELVDWLPAAARDDEAVDLLADTLLPQLFRAKGSAAVREVTERLHGQLDLAERLRLGRAVVALHLQEEDPHPGSEEGVNAAVLKLMELLRETREAADAYEAEELARRLEVVLEERGPAVDAVVAGWAREELERFDGFIEKWEPHRAKILEDVEQKALDLREHWRDRTVHVFTGHQADGLTERFERLSQMLELEVELHRWAERGVLNGVRPGRDVVVLLPRWAGHADTAFVEERCRDRTVECYTLPQRTVNPERIVAELWERVG